jgi:hypothetical protein
VASVDAPKLGAHAVDDAPNVLGKAMSNREPLKV